MAPSLVTLVVASLLVSLTVAIPGAMPWSGPAATPMGLMATAGISPRPTQAPLSSPRAGDLRERQNQNVIFPPPLNWCGFANSLYADPLSCSAGLTCVNSGAAMGCCTATTGICTALYTTCANYLDTCDAACQVDPGIIKCDANVPFCGTYDFLGGTRLFNCQPTALLPIPVEFLNDFYITAIGSTIGGASTAILANSGLVSLGAASSGSPSASGSPSGGPVNNAPSSSGGGLSAAAIDGIAAGCSVGGALILGLIVFFCIRSRRKRRIARASNPSNPAYMPVTPMPPMQQQQPMQTQMPPKTVDGYQTVPQQDVQPYPMPPPQQDQQPKYPIPPVQQQQQHPQYPSPSPVEPQHQQQQQSPQGQPQQPQQQRPPSYFDSAAVAPQSDTQSSTGAPSALSPSPSNARSSYYHPPRSPNVREVDATMGNPGVLPSSPGSTTQHTEVDATLGNPSVPAGGHGIPHQGVPGGSPSSTEIDGNPVRASLNAPFNTDAYEMPHDRY